MLSYSSVWLQCCRCQKIPFSKLYEMICNYLSPTPHIKWCAEVKLLNKHLVINSITCSLSPCHYTVSHVLIYFLRINCACKYNFSDDGKKLSPRRDVPSYPKVNKHVASELGSVIHNYEPWSHFHLLFIVHSISRNYWSSEETHFWCLALGT